MTLRSLEHPKMKPPKLPVVFIIHDLNEWGGQDRSTLEIARQISFERPVIIYAFSLSDSLYPSGWGQVSFHQVKPNLQRPVVFKILYFLFRSWWDIALTRKLGSRKELILHSTGACSLANDLIQIQFVQNAWLKKSQELADDTILKTSWPNRIYHQLLLRFNCFLERSLYKKNLHYIALAKGVKDELHHFFGLKQQVTIIHHGVNSKLFTPHRIANSQENLSERDRIRKELKIPAEAQVILFVGAYSRKGLAMAIESLRHLEEAELRNTYLLAVGSGDQSLFHQKASSCGVADHLLLVTHQRNILPYYAAADLFLLPTLYEPFGLVTLEAMACGLVPIVSKNTGASELIAHGNSGYLIDDPTSSKEIAHYLKILLSDSALRSQMAAAVRSKAEQRSWTVVASEYEQLFQVIESERRSS